MDAAHDIHAILRAARRRLLLRGLLHHAARATLFFFAILVALRAYVWWQGNARPDPASLPYMLSWPVILGIIGGSVITLLRVPPLLQVARILDALGHTHDRLVSAFEFSRKNSRAPFEQLALDESGAWLRTRNLPPLVRINFPRELRWLAVPLLTLAVLWWHESMRADIRDAAIAAAQQEIRPTAESLESLANAIDARARETKDELLQRVAERLRQSAAQLRVEANRPADAHKSALRELAELEQLIRALRQPEAITASEVAALSQALTQHEETKEAARHMREGNFADAAEDLEKPRDEAAEKRLEQTLQQALERLARRQDEPSKALEQLQAAAGNSQRQQLVKQLAQLLRDLPQKPPDRPDAQPRSLAGEQPAEQKPMTDEDLKKLLGALQELKDQQQNPDATEGGEPGQQKQDGAPAVSMLSFEPVPQGTPAGEIAVPSGRPGSELDPGTTKDPFADPENNSINSTARQEQLKGELGDGESLAALVPATAAGDTKATRRYKELTDAAAAAAEDAVLQENMPLGSRFLIKRYFEAIRPKQ